jgi:hypothetical protein
MWIIYRIAIVAISGSVWMVAQQHIQTPESSTLFKNTTTNREMVKMTHARGSFDVTLTPHAPDDRTRDACIARTFIEKKFHGDLEATSKVEMLSARCDVKDSGAYVAIERVSGSLNGRTGTFFLQHSGTMTRGVQKLSITVVPDSGTGQLVGLAGKLDIKIAEGKHSYDFEYTLGQSP